MVISIARALLGSKAFLILSFVYALVSLAGLLFVTGMAGTFWTVTFLVVVGSNIAAALIVLSARGRVV